MRPCGTFDRHYSEDMAIFRTRFQRIALIAGLLFLFGIFPQVAGSYLLSITNFMGIYIIAALGLQIILGYCGLISLGHVALVAIGAFTTGVLSYHLGWSWIAILPCAIVGSSLVAVIFGLPAVRIKGFYIVLSTMACHFIVTWLILHGGDVTGGVWGLPVAAPTFGGVVISSERSYFLLIMTCLVIATYLAKNLVRMKLGRAWIAVRDNDIAAEFAGINVFQYKLLACGIGGAFAGVAGALLAPYLGMVEVGHFSFLENLWYLGFIIVGGMGSITATFFGVIFLLALRQLAMIVAPMLGGIVPALSIGISAALMEISFGVVVILFIVFEPRGLYHRWEIAKSSFRLWPYPY